MFLLAQLLAERLGRLGYLARPLHWRYSIPFREEKMNLRYVNQCEYCRSEILTGQRWVREKIYAPESQSPSYHRYHAELFAGQEASCWEKHQMEREFARTTAYAA
jgi:hypothetical protein